VKVGATTLALFMVLGLLVVPSVAIAAGPSYHYDTNTIPTSSITVGTPSCTGGGLNLETAWRNRIDATQSNCRAYHYDYTNYSGYMEATTAHYYDTLAVGNRNKTESIKYYS